MAYTKKGLENSLKTFLKENPSSKINGDGTSFYISKPWNDRTLMIMLPDDDGERSKLIRSLNKLIFPPAFSAFYHRKDRMLEVAWTAYKLPATLTPVSTRSFDFSLNGNTHHCSFETASTDFLNVSRHILPYTSANETDHRNILSFFLFLNQSEGEASANSRFDKPRTFKISNIEGDESEMIKIISHLNFFMTYYDSKSPQVRIHTLGLGENRAGRDRYLHGKFPENVDGRELDSRIISFWRPQQSSTSLMQFLFYYRIMEFAASQYVDAKIRSKLRRLINDPKIKDNNHSIVEKIVETVDVKKKDEIPRLKSLVRETVELDLIWSVVESHKDSFCKQTAFEGGYVSEPFLTEKCSINALSTGIDKMTDTIRKIRNALSHGRDVESGGVITPSPKNERLLEPWVLLLEIIAGQVILYKDVL